MLFRSLIWLIACSFHCLYCEDDYLLTGIEESASAQGSEESDELEPLNRVLFSIHETLDDYVLVPFSSIYDHFTPGVVQDGVDNLTSNLKTPFTFVQCALQGRGDDSATTIARFFINTLMGFFGFFDPASELGLHKVETNMDETLTSLGVPTGSYFIIPALGPSSLRGLASTGLDTFADPLYYVISNKKRSLNKRRRESYTYYGLTTLSLLRKRFKYVDFTNDLKKSPDRYVLIRNFYFQQKAQQKKDVEQRKKARKGL